MRSAAVVGSDRSADRDGDLLVASPEGLERAPAPGATRPADRRSADPVRDALTVLVVNAELALLMTADPVARRRLDRTLMAAQQLSRLLYPAGPPSRLPSTGPCSGVPPQARVGGLGLLVHAVGAIPAAWRPDTPAEQQRTHLACAVVNIELALRMLETGPPDAQADRLRAALAAVRRAAGVGRGAQQAVEEAGLS